MDNVLYALYMTMELWIFAGILMIALLVEEGVRAIRARNERKQMAINLEIDRLHR